jgi:hypothetical protein
MYLALQRRLASHTFAPGGALWIRTRSRSPGCGGRLGNLPPRQLAQVGFPELQQREDLEAAPCPHVPACSLAPRKCIKRRLLRSVGLTNAYRLRLPVHGSPPVGTTPRACLDSVRDRIAWWICDVFRQNGMPGVAIPFDGTCLRPRHNTELWSDQQGCETHQFATLDWTIPSGNVDSTLRRCFTADLACDDRTVEVALQVHGLSSPFILRPAHFNLHANNPMVHVPILAGQLLQAWPCRVAGQVVWPGGRTLTSDKMDAFVQETLLNPERALPVVLLRVREPFRHDVAAFQTWLLGVAEVAVVADDRGVTRLSALLGPQLGHVGGGLRIYWPGLTCHSNPADHPSLSHEELVQKVSAGQLEKSLLMRFHDSAGARFREGELIRAARQALTRDRVEWQRAATEASAAAQAALADARQARQDSDRLRQQADEAGRLLLESRARIQELQIRAAHLEANELIPALEGSWDANCRLLAELEASRRRVADLEQALRAHEENWAQLAVAYQGPSKLDEPSQERPRDFETTAEALQTAAAEFSDVLEVWEDAVCSAAASPYAVAAKVFQALKAIAEVGRSYFAAKEGGPPLGRIEQAFAGRVPFKYTAFESATTLSHHGQQRIFHHRGRSLQMQRHLTLGGGTTNNCLQIYFEFDDDSRRVLIGYCGRHLPYHRQRT